jgi:hypothetical protein
VNRPTGTSGVRAGVARFGCERGQSLTEFALALPVILLILLGVADLGRVFYYTSAIANAAREGASYAARSPGVADDKVRLRVCQETGFLDCSSGLPARLQVTRISTAGNETVRVSYDFDLISGYLVNAVFRANPIRMELASTFPTMR